MYFIMLHLSKTRWNTTLLVVEYYDIITNNVLNSSTSYYIAQYYIILFCTISLYAKLDFPLLIPCYLFSDGGRCEHLLMFARPSPGEHHQRGRLQPVHLWCKQ